jgi:hypothetical protein
MQRWHLPTKDFWLAVIGGILNCHGITGSPPPEPSPLVDGLICRVEQARGFAFTAIDWSCGYRQLPKPRILSSAP